jgi:hypothetical protein
MQVRDSDLFAILERISSHYKANVGNRYLRAAFLSMTLDQKSWEMIDSVTEKYQYYSTQGFHLDELYERIIALARFVYHARREIQPNLRSILGGRSQPVNQSPNDRVLREMAMNNFNSNLSILADQINVLYVLTVEIDTKMNAHEIPVYKKIAELQNLGRYLLS